MQCLLSQPTCTYSSILELPTATGDLHQLTFLLICRCNSACVYAWVSFYVYSPVPFLLSVLLLAGKPEPRALLVSLRVSFVFLFLSLLVCTLALHHVLHAKQACAQQCDPCMPFVSSGAMPTGCQVCCPCILWQSLPM